VIPGWCVAPDPESRDSGFDASHRPGMTVDEKSGCPAHRRAEATPSFRRLCPGMTTLGLHFSRSGVLLFEPVVLDDIEARIDQLALQQIQRRLAVEFEVVEGIGQDLGHPDE